MSHQIMFIVSIIGAALLGLNVINAFPDGAPDDSCDHMRPGHRDHNSTASVKPLIEPQSGPPFYSILVDKTRVKPNEEVLVTIVAKEYYFAGFVIQARDVDQQGSGSVKKYGTFTALNNKTKVICNNQAATHTDREYLKNITVKWTAPNEALQDIRFTATVVKSYAVFFMNVQSETLNISGAIFHIPSFILMMCMLCFTAGFMSL